MTGETDYLSIWINIERDAAFLGDTPGPDGRTLRSVLRRDRGLSKAAAREWLLNAALAIRSHGRGVDLCLCCGCAAHGDGEFSGGDAMDGSAAAAVRFRFDPVSGGGYVH